MIAYSGKHGAKQCIHRKPINFGCKVSAAATCQGYCIQFILYLGTGSSIDPVVGLDGSVVDKLVSCCQISMVPSIILSPTFKNKERLCYRHNTSKSNGKPPLPDMKAVEKNSRGTYEAVVDVASNVVVALLERQ